jgi:hypothetical protein
MASTFHAPWRARGLIPWLIASWLVSPAAGDEFSWQLSGGVSEAEVGSGADADSAALSGTYFFRPVDDSTGPYALAPFLERASHIGASYHEDKTTALVPVFINLSPNPLPPSPPVTLLTRAAGRALSGRYVFGDAGWFVGAGLAEADAAHPAPLSTSFSMLGDELETRSVSFGRYLGRATTITLALENAEASIRSVVPVPCFLCTLFQPSTIMLTRESEDENVGLSARHVGRLGRMQYSLSGGIAASRAEATTDIVITQATPNPPFFAIAGGFEPSFSERRDRYELVGELFSTQALGIRVGYARWDGEPALDDSYELGATWFFRRNVGAELVLTRTDSGLPIRTVLDVDTVGLRFIGRL